MRIVLKCIQIIIFHCSFLEISVKNNNFFLYNILFTQMDSYRPMQGQKDDNICHFSWFQQPQEIVSMDSIGSRSGKFYYDIDMLEVEPQLRPVGQWNHTIILGGNSESKSLRNVNDAIMASGQEIAQAKSERQIKREFMQAEEMRVSKDQRFDKQHLYSKAYRERKKEQYKTLEQENNYLKKRISQLEYQIRQQQLQLNRFKFPPPEKQLTIQELRRQFLASTVDIFVQKNISPNQQLKIVYTPKDPFYHQFLDIYGERGFAGTKKVKLLNYYFNEILEGILKDSERYLSLMFARNKKCEKLESLPQFEPIFNAFQNVFHPDEDLQQRLKYFAKNLSPLHLQLNKYCSDFYHAFQNISNCSQKIHNFIRDSYLSNMDVARRRIELQTWFQFHKYGKMLRKLRFQWLDLIKSGNDVVEEQSKKNLKGKKKKKTNKDEEQSK